MQIVFHIGQQKAASSTIQTCLAGNRDVLLSQGVMYPTAFGKNNARMIVDYVTNAPTMASGRDFVSELFRKEFAAGSSSAVISYENLFGGDVALQLRETFAPYASSWRVLCYLRRPDEHIVSLYQEYVKGSGYCGTIDDFIELYRQDRYYYYTDALDRWSGVFGEGAVEVRLFHRSTLKGSPFEDFADWIGVDPRGMTFEAERRVNQSFDRVNIEILRFLNLCCLEQPERVRTLDVKRLRARLRELDTGQRLRLDAARAARVQEQFRADHERLAERHLTAEHASILLAPPAEVGMPTLDRDALFQRMMSLFNDVDFAHSAVARAERPASGHWAPRDLLEPAKPDQVHRLARWQDRTAKKASRLASMGPDERARAEARRSERKKAKRQKRSRDPGAQ